MRRHVFVVVLVLTLGIAVGLSAAAEEKKVEKPKPGPEHARLAYLVGTWSFEGESAPNPFGPGGKFSGTETCEWFSGDFAVVCRSSGRGPRGEMKGMGIMGYDLEEKMYTYFGVDNMGSTEKATGVVSGDTWTWTAEGKVQGKSYKFRLTMKEVSPDSYTSKAELSEDGASWTVINQGKATRVKKEHKPAK